MKFYLTAAGSALFCMGVLLGRADLSPISQAQAATPEALAQQLASNPQFVSSLAQAVEGRLYKSQAFRHAVEDTVRSAAKPRNPTLNFEYELRNAITRCRVSGENIRC